MGKEGRLEQVVDFLHKIENLKSTLRYNNTKSGRKESTAEHSRRLALMTFMIIDELKLDVDINKCIKIALVHDLAEAVTGDIDAIKIAEGVVSKEEKELQEIKAMQELQATLPDTLGTDIFNLRNEYNEGNTKEAMFVKALDKIETLTQLAETGYTIYDKPQFIANYANKAVNKYPKLLPLLKIVKRKLKEEFIKGNIERKDEYDDLD